MFARKKSEWSIRSEWIPIRYLIQFRSIFKCKKNSAT